MATPRGDEGWAGIARSSRAALNLLGYHIDSECLPGEPNECGGNFQGHAAAHLIALRTVADHHLNHALDERGGEWECAIADKTRRDIAHS